MLAAGVRNAAETACTVARALTLSIKPRAKPDHGGSANMRDPYVTAVPEVAQLIMLRGG